MTRKTISSSAEKTEFIIPTDAKWREFISELDLGPEPPALDLELLDTCDVLGIETTPGTTSVELAHLLLREVWRAESQGYFFWDDELGWLNSVTGEPWEVAIN